ncbi:unnamed protein product [Aspergillus oryzae RIB40]|nr:unnamed protein product [Aspergillus oryzae RIB40]BAE56417.1 unnamed protein product [Aspergillus oryzae RIB40]
MPTDRVCVMKAGAFQAVEFRSSSQGFIYLGKWQLRHTYTPQWLENCCCQRTKHSENGILLPKVFTKNLLSNIPPEKDRSSTYWWMRALIALENLATSQQSPTLGLCLSHIIGCRLISSGRRHDQEETSAAAYRHEAHEYS